MLVCLGSACCRASVFLRELSLSLAQAVNRERVKEGKRKGKYDNNNISIKAEGNDKLIEAFFLTYHFLCHYVGV